MNFPLRRKNPDILTCLANLSSDEVFTPPKIANDMLDLLPQQLFSNPFIRFLDPACKSGVFLREIVKRLIVGLEGIFPDLQVRVEHIMKYQVYGIALTDLTAMLSRRTVYCSRNADSDYSVCNFESKEGRIRFRKYIHDFVKGKCRYCGASKQKKEKEGEESHAYEFIHTDRPEDIWKKLITEGRQEDILGQHINVVISNPPYHMEDGGHGRSAKPIYHKFIEQAKKLNPQYIVMIIPARWYTGGKGLDDFRRDMLNDRHIRVLYDFFNPEECFPDIDLSGGVCYFLWDRDYNGDCEIITHRGENISVMTRPLIDKQVRTFIRFNEAVPIVHKVKSFYEKSFADMVSPRKPFGLATDVLGEPKSERNNVRLYSNKNAQKEKGYVSREDITQNEEWVDEWKVLISRAYGERGNFPYIVTGKPFIGEPDSVCSETYVVIGPFNDRETCENVISYITTKFFRFLVLLRKNTQDATREVYSFVPVQDFSRSWSDEDLYAKYGLTPEEIAFIDSMIRPMTIKEDKEIDC